MSSTTLRPDDDLTGMVFGAWTVVGPAPPRDNNRRMWLCRCSCLNEQEIRGTGLRSGRSTRCRSCVASLRQGNMRSPGQREGYQDGKGYRVIYRRGHPNARPKGRGQIAEHVFVMSEMLGRPLLPGENVHHKNGVRDDNRPENLELWVTTQPAGQRPEDLLAWAYEIIERYGKG